MTITEPTSFTGQTGVTPFAAVTLDLYRDIHKGIRAELFGVTGATGRLDPADRGARVGTAADVDRIVDMLISHAGHEDAVVQPEIVKHLPDLGARIETDHAALEARMDGLRELAGAAADASRADARHAIHQLYIELASFTSDYLAHQDVEERVVMPALEAAVGFEVVLDLHQAIIGSIPPAEMAQGLATMLPAMNIDDRADLLGGMRAGAPSEVFAGVWGLAQSVLMSADSSALAARLGLSV